MENLENNKLIAEFMGYAEGSDFQYLSHPDTYFDTDVDDLKYHKSWDWLMPVVERIEGIENGIYQIDILQEGSRILKRCQKTEIDNTVRNVPTETTKIESVYLSVVQFIKHYNENLKPQ